MFSQRKEEVSQAQLAKRRLKAQTTSCINIKNAMVEIKTKFNGLAENQSLVKRPDE